MVTVPAASSQCSGQSAIPQGNGREGGEGWLHWTGCDCNSEANSLAREDPDCTSGHMWRDVDPGLTVGQHLQCTVYTAISSSATADGMIVYQYLMNISG